MSIIVTHPATVAQFENLKKAVQSDHADIQSVSFSDLTSGTLSTHDVDLGFHFTNGILTATVLDKKSFMARHAPESVVQSHLETLLNEFLGA